ncbi:MAG: tetratricopeptide repeat protein [Planctomycetota bacterium]
MRRTVGLLVSVLPLLTTTVFAQARDQILRRSEGPILAEVVSENYEKVVYKDGAEQAEIPTDQVKDIIYSNTPDSYYTAEDLRDRGQYENAIKSFKLAQNDGNTGEWVKEYTRFQIAECYRRWGGSHFDDAISAYEGMISQHPESRFLAPALFGLGMSQMSAGLTSAAIDTFSKLESEASSKRLGEYWIAKARFEKAWGQLAAKQFGPARNTFASAGSLADSVLSRNEDLPQDKKRELEELQVGAKLAEGDSYLEEGKVDQAESFFSNLSRSASASPALQAGALNGLGECLFKKKQFEQARYEFTRANVLFRGSAEQIARSLFWLGRCVEEMQEPRWETKQTSYWEELRQQYPESRWSDRLREIQSQQAGASEENR